MIKSFFISRSLSSDSPILAVLRDQDINVRAQSLIAFAPLQFEIPRTSWVFFYSKNGVRFFFEFLKKSDEPFDQYNIICYGPVTAEYCNQYSEVKAHAGLSPEKAFDLIKSHASVENITFIRGRNSIHAVQKITDQPLQDLVVYSNRPIANLQLSHFDIAVLTSPLNAKTFIDSGGTANTYISIGNTTKNTLAEFKISTLLATEPSEAGISLVLSELLKK